MKQIAEDAETPNDLEKEDSDSEVPSDLLLTSDKIPEIEDEEVTYPSGFSPMDSPMDVELPRSDIKVTYDPFSEGIEFQNKQRELIDDSSDSDDSISRGLNFHDVSLPDAPGSGAKGTQVTSSESSFHRELGHLHLPSVTSTTTSSQKSAKDLTGKSNSPNWNIVNNLWDAVNSSVTPDTHHARISTKIEDPGSSSMHSQRKNLAVELSSDESDFELVDTDDLNIST